jgi:hypothetical protein
LTRRPGADTQREKVHLHDTLLAQTDRDNLTQEQLSLDKQLAAMTAKKVKVNTCHAVRFALAKPSSQTPVASKPNALTPLEVELSKCDDDYVKLMQKKDQVRCKKCPSPVLRPSSLAT